MAVVAVMAVMASFVAIPILITMAVVATIFPMAVVAARMTLMIVIVITFIERQPQNHTTHQASRKTEIVMRLGGRSNSQGCSKKGR
jgi:archaellum biogenesis protein FlaJ (TadC family)